MRGGVTAPSFYLFLNFKTNKKWKLQDLQWWKLTRLPPAEKQP
jgi:hypothetical protein